MSAIEWVPVSNKNGKEVGAVGFVADEAVALTCFFDESDWNQDGKVELAEKIRSFVPIFGRSTGLMEVATLGYGEPDIRERDPQYGQVFAQQFTRFATRLVIDGVYLVYFRGPVSSGSGAVARAVVHGRVKQWLVKKGTEAVVKKAFEVAIAR